MRSETWSYASREKIPGGLSTHRWRIERPWGPGLGDDGSHMAQGSGSRTGRHARWDDMARVLANAPAKYARGRFLHGRDDLAATAIRALLHRTGHPPCPCRGMHAEPERAVGDTAGPATDIYAGRTRRIFCFLIRDRDQKFTDGFDELFRSSGLEIIRTPFCAPQANGVAERFVRTVRSECLDWLLILNNQHLERVLAVFLEHYNGHRPHRALALTPPRPTRPRWRRRWSRARLVSSVAIVSVGWFTSTSWRRDQICEPYRRRALDPVRRK
jgi:transposase InsO family protein